MPIDEVDRTVMGTPDQAKDMLIEKAREWRLLRQPQIATCTELKRNDVRESQVRFELANAALLWLWHEEHHPTEADMRAFGASDAACYKWPGDTAQDRALRAAYIEGAADSANRGQGNV